MPLRSLAAVAFAVNCLSAQPSFEAASIKLNTGVSKGTGSVDLLPGRVRAENVLVRGLIQNAYDVRPFQIVGGPGWIDSIRYDIDAKAAGNAPPAELRRMLQALLEERFQLRAHRETREVPVYVLSPAKGGLKLAPAKESCSVEDEGAPPVPGSPRPCGRIFARITLPDARLDGAGISMPGLTRLLANLLWRPVVDNTGYTGKFDVHIDFAADDALGLLSSPYRPDTPPPVERNEPGSVSIYTAMRQQLGIKLEAAKGPAETIVIDRIERATEN